MKNLKTLSQTAIEVTVVGGYLGAGKTTLMNHILTASKEPVAVLINDFGDINIDSELIESVDGNSIALTNGCICCSLVDGYVSALEELRLREPTPKRIIIEASGVADPASVAAYGHAPGLYLNAVVVMVDGANVMEQLDDSLVAQPVAAQIATADLLAVNKKDLLKDLGTVRNQLKKLNAEALITDCTNSQIDLDVLFGSEVATEAVVAAEMNQFDSRSHRSNDPISRQALTEWVERLPDEVQRAKGVLRLDEEPQIPMVFQLVGKRWNLRALAERKNPPLGNQIVVVGPKGSVPEDWDVGLR